MEGMEIRGTRPRQVRYQAALRPDIFVLVSFYITSLIRCLAHAVACRDCNRPLLTDGRAARHFPAHHRDQAVKAGCPVGEEVDVLQFTLDRARDGTTVETDGNQEDFVERDLAGAVQRVADFGLEATFLIDRVFGVAGHEEIRGFNGGFDGAGPVLAGEEFADVHPGAEAGRFQGFVELFRDGGVFLYMSQKDTGTLRRLEAKAEQGVGKERTQTVNLDDFAGGDAANHHLRQLLDGGLNFCGTKPILGGLTVPDGGVSTKFSHGVCSLRVRRRRGRRGRV